MAMGKARPRFLSNPFFIAGCIVATLCLGGYFLAPYILINLLERSVKQEFDVDGGKGLTKYGQLGGISLPAGTVCLKGSYSHFQDTMYEFTFWSPNLPKVPTSKSDARTSSPPDEFLAKKLREIQGPSGPPQNPTESYYWSWSTPQLGYRLDCLKSSNGYFTVAQIFEY